MNIKQVKKEIKTTLKNNHFQNKIIKCYPLKTFNVELYVEKEPFIIFHPISCFENDETHYEINLDKSINEQIDKIFEEMIINYFYYHFDLTKDRLLLNDLEDLFIELNKDELFKEILKEKQKNEFKTLKK